MKKKFSILITTKNRINDLKVTLQHLDSLLLNPELECIIFDDGSTDGSSEFIKNRYPQIILARNEVSKGLIYCRNRMMHLTQADYAISLDDDAHFLSENVLPYIEQYFTSNPKCGLQACRIFWGIQAPDSIGTSDKPVRTKGFVGCGHVWRMEAWHAIPDYPDWFIFYGEEEFAAFHLFRQKWEVHYVPELLVHHRVDVKSRKHQSDYQLRLRRSLRSGWYLYLMFYPVSQIPRRFLYTLSVQIKKRILKGDLKAVFAILQAFGDVVINFQKWMRHSKRFTTVEMRDYSELPQTKIYWTPEK